MIRDSSHEAHIPSPALLPLPSRLPWSECQPSLTTNSVSFSWYILHETETISPFSSQLPFLGVQCIGPSMHYESFPKLQNFMPSCYQVSHVQVAQDYYFSLYRHQISFWRLTTFVVLLLLFYYTCVFLTKFILNCFSNLPLCFRLPSLQTCMHPRTRTWTFVGIGSWKVTRPWGRRMFLALLRRFHPTRLFFFFSVFVAFIFLERTGKEM